MYGTDLNPLDEPEFWRMEQHKNYEIMEDVVQALGLSITFGANGQIIVLKKNPEKRGQPSLTLYKWTGEQPQGPSQAELRRFTPRES